MNANISVSTASTGLFIFGQGSEWFWIMVQSIVVVVTLLFIYRQVRLSRYGNMLDTMLKFRTFWRSDTMMKDRKITCQNYQNQSTSIGKAEGEVLGFFEEIGLLVRKGVISVEFVWECYSYYIERYWAMMKENIREYRKFTKDETWFEHFQKLKERMQIFSEKRNASSRPVEKEEIQKFIKGECET